jgi:hypothetical protein
LIKDKGDDGIAVQAPEPEEAVDVGGKRGFREGEEPDEGRERGAPRMKTDA